MQGKILDYNSEFKSGLIRAEDGNKYRFSIDDCKSAITPKAGADVDFEPNGDKAIEVYILTKDHVDDIKNVASSVAVKESAEILNTKKSSDSKKVVSKIVILIIAVIIVIFSLVPIINILDKHNSKTEIFDLQNKCALDDAQACFDTFSKAYSYNSIYNENPLLPGERGEALYKAFGIGYPIESIDDPTLNKEIVCKTSDLQQLNRTGHKYINRINSKDLIYFIDSGSIKINRNDKTFNVTTLSLTGKKADPILSQVGYNIDYFIIDYHNNRAKSTVANHFNCNGDDINIGNTEGEWFNYIPESAIGLIANEIISAYEL